MRGMLSIVEHPKLLVIIALVCSPMLVYFARRLLDEAEELLQDIERRAISDIWWRLLRLDDATSYLWGRAIIYLVVYAIVVGMSYASLVRHLYPAQA